MAESQDQNRDTILQTLSAILESKGFVDSPQLSEFLKFIVHKTVEGEQDNIKAYTIAVDALGRPDDFDPQSNSFVRVAAGRLRQALALYNAQEAPTDTQLFITLEPGSYIPTFRFVVSPTERPDEQGIVDEEAEDGADSFSGKEDGLASIDSPRSAQIKSDSNLVDLTRNSLLASLLTILALTIIAGAGLYYFGYFSRPISSDFGAGKLTNTADANRQRKVSSFDADRRPSIEVSYILPDQIYPDWFKTQEVADALRVSFARFDDYQFNGLSTYLSTPARDKRGADYHFWITAYARGDGVRIYGQIKNETSGQVIWSSEDLFTRPNDLQGRNVPDVVGQYLAVLASPYGVIYSDVAKRQPRRKKLNCVVWAFAYFSSKSDAGHTKARECAESQIEEGTTLPSIYAALTFLYLDEYREGRNRRARDPLRAAEEMAERAINLNPASARAHQALFAVHKVRGNKKQARQYAQKAVDLNPYDIDISGDYGAWLISVGDNSAGRKLIDQVAKVQSAPPAWVEFYRFLGAELDGDFKQADAVASVLDFYRSPFAAIAVAISSHRRGDRVMSSKAMTELTNTDQVFKTDPKKALLARGFSEGVADKVVSKLVGAGLEIETAPLN